MGKTLFSGELGIKFKQRPLTVKVPAAWMPAIEGVGDRSGTLRRWIREGMERDGLLPASDEAVSSEQVIDH